MSRKYDWTGNSYTVTKPEFIKKNLKKLTDYDFDLLHYILIREQIEAKRISENQHGVYSDKTVEEYKRHFESVNRLLASFDCPSEINAWGIGK